MELTVNYYCTLRSHQIKKSRRVDAKREKGYAIIVKTDESKYSKVLKAMTSYANLVDLGVDIRCFRSTLTGKMILEFKHDKTRKGARTNV